MSVRFVLVRPRSPGNVGAVARAMKNFGFSDLALVDPRLHREGDEPGAEPYFERESRRMAWHASDLLDSAQTFPDLKAALAPCSVAYATAPQAYSRLPALTPEGAAEELASGSERPVALVFGSESSGLTLEEMALCAGVVVIPTDSSYRDLNLAQSAVLMAYLIFRAAGRGTHPQRASGAGHEEVQRSAEALLELARRSGFLQHGGEPVARELQSFMHRTRMSEREAGLFASLFRKIAYMLQDR